jgi:hypothetical protein
LQSLRTWAVTVACALQRLLRPKAEDGIVPTRKRRQMCAAIGARLMLEPTGLLVHKFDLQRMSKLEWEIASATGVSLRTS